MWRPGAVEGKLMGLRKITTKNPQTARRVRPSTEEGPGRRGSLIWVVWEREGRR